MNQVIFGVEFFLEIWCEKFLHSWFIGPAMMESLTGCSYKTGHASFRCEKCVYILIPPRRCHIFECLDYFVTLSSEIDKWMHLTIKWAKVFCGILDVCWELVPLIIRSREKCWSDRLYLFRELWHCRSLVSHGTFDWCEQCCIFFVYTWTKCVQCTCEIFNTLVEAFNDSISVTGSHRLAFKGAMGSIIECYLNVLVLLMIFCCSIPVDCIPQYIIQIGPFFHCFPYLDVRQKPASINILDLTWFEGSRLISFFG